MKQFFKTSIFFLNFLFSLTTYGQELTDPMLACNYTGHERGGEFWKKHACVQTVAGLSTLDCKSTSTDRNYDSLRVWTCRGLKQGIRGKSIEECFDQLDEKWNQINGEECAAIYTAIRELDCEQVRRSLLRGGKDLSYKGEKFEAKCKTYQFALSKTSLSCETVKSFSDKLCKEDQQEMIGRCEAARLVPNFRFLSKCNQVRAVLSLPLHEEDPCSETLLETISNLLQNPELANRPAPLCNNLDESQEETASTSLLYDE